MKVSVVVSVYKDVEALSLIVDSLLGQTVLADEIIISEDGDSREVRDYSGSLGLENVIHLSQEDKGWQKNKALNRAITVARGDYLIFLDGDCVPFPDFLENHISLSEVGTVLSGRRIDLGEQFSEFIRARSLCVLDFVSKYVVNFFKLRKDGLRHYEDGLCFQPDSFTFRMISAMRRKENRVVGCNFSCWKEDLENINGWDEDFTEPTYGEDTDLERRMRHFGVVFKSCRFSANVIHLYHKKTFNRQTMDRMEAVMESKKGVFICRNGMRA